MGLSAAAADGPKSAVDATSLAADRLETGFAVRQYIVIRAAAETMAHPFLGDITDPRRAT